MKYLILAILAVISILSFLIIEKKELTNSNSLTSSTPTPPIEPNHYIMDWKIYTLEETVVPPFDPAKQPFRR